MDGQDGRAEGALAAAAKAAVRDVLEHERKSMEGFADLGRLSRSSMQCHDELVEAAQQELQEQRKQRLKLRTVTKQQAAQAAHEFLQAPAGFGQFSAQMARFFRLVGVEFPTVTIEYRGLGVVTQALVGSSGVATVGNTLVQVAKDIFTSGGQTMDLHILKDVSGVLKPGTLTLLLGSPGSGKSTLQKLLSGRLKAKNLKVSGSVLYNGKDFSQFVVERTSAYVDQHDRHLPVLTVGETLEFAHKCSGSRPDYFTKQEVQEAYARSVTGNLSKVQSAANITEASDGTITTEVQGEGGVRQMADAVMEADGFVHSPGEQDFSKEEFTKLLRLGGSTFKVELVLRLLGLAHARDTIIGNAMMRGVSGGERKRVTSGEMLVGNQRVLMMDEISTGLDSATLYSIVTFLKQSVGALRNTTMVSLLQPPPEVMGLFDDIILMAEGYVIYHGPVADVQAHFNFLGLDLPSRMDLPSWLVEITTPAGQWKYARGELKLQWSKRPDSARLLQAAASSRKQAAWDVLAEAPVDPATGKLPMLLSAEELNVAFWKGNSHGKTMMQELDKGVASPAAAANPRSLVQQWYALKPPAALKLAISRQWTLFLRNKAFTMFRLTQVVVMGCIIGSLFFNVPADRSGYRVLLGGSFITLMFLAFGSAPELGLLLMNRTVWYKHRDNLFLPTYAETISMALVRSVSTALEVLLYANIVYWMMGYTKSAGAYFTYLLIIFMISLAISGLFRFLGAVSPSAVHAQAFGSIGILILVLTSGFAIVRTSIPGWWIWAYYISPFSYGLRAIAINEMSTERWSAPAPGNAGKTLGEEGLELFGFFTDRAWIWAGVGYLIGFALVMNLLAHLALKYYSGQQERASVPDEQDVLQRRLKAEQRKQQYAATLAVLEDNNTAAAAGKGKVAASMDFTPITLVVRNLRYFVPNPAAGRKAKAASAAANSSTASATTPAADDGNTNSDSTDSTSAAATNVSHAGAQDAHVSVVVQAVAPEAEAVPAELELLKGIDMFAEPGQMMCLMGGSGAGKTTLMDVIAGRKTVGRITGDIIVNGQPKQQASWARQVGYCEQMDIHSPAATVEEALWFSGRLRLPPSVSDSQVRSRIDEVLSVVDLTERSADLVGVPGASGLPTEARKRLTIAVELVANPPVVFMDEPTSGLDARAAAIVMSAVKAVAAGGHTVMVTIHQPSLNIFESFETLMLLQRGGRCTYFGPLGEHSSALVQYLEAVPGTAKLMPGYNPATWMLEVTGGAMATLVPANNSVDWPSVYQSSELCLANLARAEALVEQGRQQASKALPAAGSNGSAPRPCPAASGYAQPFSRQLWECTLKLSQAYWRMPAYNLMRIILTTITALIYGSMYYRAGRIARPASISNVQNVMGVLYSGASFLGNVNLMSGMPVFGTERVVFYRERAALMYAPLATGLATLLAELPYVVAQATVFTPIVYWMVDFAHDAEKFWFYYLMIVAMLMMFTSFGLFLVSATPMVELAQLLSSALNVIFNIFNGFTITYNAIPDGWKWANRIVPATWIIYGLGASQLGDNYGPLVGPGLAAGTTVSSYMETVFGYSYSFRWYALLITAAYVLGFMILAVLFMHKSFLKR